MSDLTLIIGNKNYSSWSLRPWLLMQHFGLTFNEQRVALYTDTTDNELAAYQSDFKVPVLQDGELIVWDSLAIMEYVSETYLHSAGWPQEPEARAIARSVSNEMHSSFMHVRNEMPMNVRKHFHGHTLSPEAEREVERIKTLWQRCRTNYGSAGEWLFGEFSIADAMYAPIALRFDGYGVPLAGIAAGYVQSVLDHPAVLAWIEAGKAEREIIQEAEVQL